MVRKKGLGRGLDALIPQNIIETTSSDSIVNIELSKIIRREDQPRTHFEKDKIRELANSIKEYGVISPIIVRKKDEKYEIIAGERRFLASLETGLSEIPAIVKEMEDSEVAEVSLIENIQREDLNAVEEAVAYKNLMENYNLTQKELADKLSKSRSYIANTLRLLNLDELSLEHLKKGNITSSQARSLLAIDDMKKRKALLDKLLSKKTNVREIEKVSKETDPFLLDLQNRFLEKFSTKVRIKPRRKGGSIEIEYLSNEDLERIMEILEL